MKLETINFNVNMMQACSDDGRYEDARAVQHRIWQDVLLAIAEGNHVDAVPAALAEAALETLNIQSQ